MDSGALGTATISAASTLSTLRPAATRSAGFVVTSSKVTGTYVDPSAGKITFADWWREWSQRQVWARGTVLSANIAAKSVTFGDLP